MPSPEGIVEAYFALLISDETLVGDEPRYFVLERTAEANDDHPLGVVCEWLRDGRRRNHHVRVRATEQDFSATVAELLRRDALRRESGVQHSAAIAWNPSKREKPIDVVMEVTFRVHHCLFAFEILPKSLLSSKEKWKQAIKMAGFDELLLQLWDGAAALAASLGDYCTVSPAGLSGQLDCSIGTNLLVVTLPKPVAAPEPFFLAVQTSVDGAGFTPGRIYTAESTEDFNAPPIIGVIDHGLHAILGQACGPLREDFLVTLRTILSGGTLPICPVPMLHLEHYLKIDKLINGDMTAH
jgi:hypothetical protein